MERHEASPALRHDAQVILCAGLVGRPGGIQHAVALGAAGIGVVAHKAVHLLANRHGAAAVVVQRDHLREARKVDSV